MNSIEFYVRNFYLQAASASMTSLDVYCFGHILYEITFGQSLLSPTADEYPPHCPDIISKLLASSVCVKIK
jgi:PX domain-containing protein kinase-like protein